MNNNFQRVGAISNAQVGRDFEQTATAILARQGVHVEHNFAVEVGIGPIRKRHSFDLGSDNPPVLVECKSHRWTTGGNVPSAKLTVWNEAMYYFACSPKGFRKILFVLRDERETTGETLAQYYVRVNSHLIPENVEIWEFDPSNDAVHVLNIAFCSDSGN